MQSFWMQMTDTAAVLELRNTPVPVAGPGQLLVRLRAGANERQATVRVLSTRGGVAERAVQW